MFIPITQIENLSQFKKDICNGKIFVFQKSKITEQLITEIKKKIENNIKEKNLLKISKDLSSYKKLLGIRYIDEYVRRKAGKTAAS